MKLKMLNMKPIKKKRSRDPLKQGLSIPNLQSPPDTSMAGTRAPATGSLRNYEGY